MILYHIILHCIIVYCMILCISCFSETHSSLANLEEWPCIASTKSHYVIVCYIIIIHITLNYKLILLYITLNYIMFNHIRLQHVILHYIMLYPRSPLQDSRLFGPSPWKILAATYEQMGSWATQPLAKILRAGILLWRPGVWWCTEYLGKQHEYNTAWKVAMRVLPGLGAPGSRPAVLRRLRGKIKEAKFSLCLLVVCWN